MEGCGKLVDGYEVAGGSLAVWAGLWAWIWAGGGVDADDVGGEGEGWWGREWTDGGWPVFPWYGKASTVVGDPQGSPDVVLEEGEVGEVDKMFDVETTENIELRLTEMPCLRRQKEECSGKFPSLPSDIALSYDYPLF